MSKFDRYKVKSEEEIFPHKHCKKCGEIIEEAYTYCANCYSSLKAKKQKKWYQFWKRKSKDLNSEESK
jgi:uncharacterized OB-fold protein